MSQRYRLTFQQILDAAAPSNAHALARRARLASRLAKAYPQRKRTLYAIKYAAIQQLFRVPGFEPVIRDAALTANQNILLLLQLIPSRWQLHLPLDRLDNPIRKQHTEWMIALAHATSTATEATVPGSRE